MQLLTPIIKKYFDDLTPGQIIKVWDTKRPCLLVWSAQEYIEQGGLLEISPDYERIIKLS